MSSLVILSTANSVNISVLSTSLSFCFMFWIIQLKVWQSNNKGLNVVKLWFEIKT